MSDTVHKWLVQAKRHQQCGEAHTWSDDAEGQADTAEDVPQKAWRNLHGEDLQADQKCEHHSHADEHGDKGSSGSSLLSGLPEQGRQHAANQSDEEAHGRSRVFLQEEGEDVGAAHEADDTADAYRNQDRKGRLQIAERVGQEIDNSLIDAENHTEHTAGDAGQYSAQADEGTLEYLDQKWHESVWILLVHGNVPPYIEYALHFILPDKKIQYSQAINFKIKYKQNIKLLALDKDEC